LVKPYTLEECQRIAIAVYHEIVSFQIRYAYRMSTGANVFGWRDDRRILEDGRLQFSVRKLFQNRTATELSQTGWSYSSTPKMRNFFAKSIDIQFHVLQQVDADSVIMYREMHSLDGVYLDKTMFLATLFRTETGYVVMYRSLDPEGRILEYTRPAAEPEMETDVGHTNLRKQHRWLDMYSW
jgi:hypothetical protein